MSDLRNLQYDDFEDMDIDEEAGVLYWKGQPVVTESRLRLERRVNWAAYLTAGSTFLLALATWIRLLGG